MGCIAPFDFLSDFYFLVFTPLVLLLLIGIVGVVRIRLHTSSNVAPLAAARPSRISA